MTEKTKSNHHTVPQFYMKGFLDKRIGKIAVLNKESKNISYQAVRNTAGVAGFYNILSNSGEEIDAIENLYSQTEDEAARITRCIVKNAFIPPPGHKYRETLSRYLSMQFFRTIKSRRREQLISDYCTKSLLIEKIKEKDANTLTKTQRDFLEYPHQIGEFTLSQDSATILEINMAKEYYFLFYERPWSLLCYNKPSLLTSDNPIVLCPYPSSKNNGLLTASEIWFPIDSRHLLILGDLSNRENIKYEGLTVRDNETNKVLMDRARRNANSLQANQSYMELFGQKELLEEQKDNCPAPASPISFHDRNVCTALEEYYDTAKMDLKPKSGYGVPIEEMFKKHTPPIKN